MIFVKDKGISIEAMEALAKYQHLVDQEATYQKRVAKAQTSFKSVNNKRNKTFREVKKGLTAMCCGVIRCNYCEDSRGDEVDHQKPKSWYPEMCFSWTNYLYACGQCNISKSNQHAVFETGKTIYTTISRKKADPILPPPYGTDVLINPRLENPLDFMFLDIATGSFMFTERGNAGTQNYLRAEYTIRILGLNSRSELAKARKSAYAHFLHALTSYVSKKKEGKPSKQLENISDCIMEDHHQTVWQEMKRQQAHLPELNKLFHAAPEALNW